ncbi:unnamed protein product [Arabis nemorensis]|uniref:RNA-dependent RNA polymerase n=1 Tax=Arabis nemorensis TaxID=586526 RepID=A0A565BFV3_9BRAS|nr:unnamed protein product [Arabis nemorensis]
MTTSTSCLNISDQAFSGSKIVLPGRVETVLEKIYKKHKQPPILKETRKRLSSISEELALETLSKVHNSTYVKGTLDGFISFLLGKAVTVNKSPRLSSGESPGTPGKKSCRLFRAERSLDSEAPSPKLLRREQNGGSLDIPQALGELEFKKMFLLLTYTQGKSLVGVITADEIRQWKDLPMAAYETVVWFRLGEQFCSLKERRASLEWESEKTHYYQCHVALDGSYRFKGPLMENTGTHLHKVLGDDNVLTVTFADVPGVSTYCNDPYPTYKGIAKNGIMVGLRRYQFFVFKDGGKEEKMKDFSTTGVKCYFIRTDSTALIDMQNPYIFSGKSIHEARMHFMHVHTLQSLASYMARFSLILSKTMKLEVDMSGITVDPIDDIHCHDQYGNDVLDKNGKPCIHSDGTGYISEDLARLCPTDICQGKRIRIQETCGKDPPLMIQFRMFKDGDAIKGTFLVNKKLPPRTVQVRPSMIKVSKDLSLSNFSTFNSLEVVNTSNPPKRTTRLSRNLIALLSYGGVPNDFFLNILCNTLEESKNTFYNIHAALKAARNYGDMDDYNAAQMLMSGIPLDEPHLQDHLSILLNTEKNDLKAGRLPVSDSYYLMGTMDPTGKLKENEVCIILESGQISGDVLVYRNPGLHFGDIHVLKATYVKALEDYVGNSKYGVFFPQKGPRSLGDEIAEIPRCAAISLAYESRCLGAAADSWLAIMDRYLVLGNEKVKEKDGSKKQMLKAIDVYYDALDAPKKGAKVDLPLDLKLKKFPHSMMRKQSFESTSILGLIYDIVVSQNAEEPPPSGIKKLPCFEDELVSKFHMEKYRRWYEEYRDEMKQAMEADENNKNESANNVIQKYKQEFYGAAGFEERKISLEELYLQALALYNIVYDHAIVKNKVRNYGFVWKVAGPVLCRFYREKTMREKSLLCSVSVLKELLG